MPEARKGRRESIDRPEYAALRRVLREAVESSGLGQREIARLLGRDHTFLNKILNGHRSIEFGELLDLCALIGADPADVVARAVVG